VVVNALPGNLTVTPASPAATCGTAISLSASISVGNTYQWKLNGTNIAGATSITYSATTSGNYTVVAVTPQGCTSAAVSNTVAVTINAVPNTPTIAGATSICSGSSTTLTTTASLGTNEAYLWSDNSSASTLSVSNAGTYSLRIRNTVTGCTSAVSNSVTVTVNTIPSAPSISGVTTFCSGGTTVLTSSSLTGNVWSTGATTPTIIVNTPGTYTVQVISNGCTSAVSSNYTVTSIAVGTWLGNSTDWNNAANWCGGIPTSTTDITLPSSGTLPIITGTSATCRNLTIPSGVTLNIGSGATFNLKGNLSGLGNVAGVTGSTLALSGSNGQTIQRVSVGTLTMNNSNGVTFAGNVNVWDGVTLTSGVINTGSNYLILANTASNPTESASSYIVGKVRTPARYVGTGSLSIVGISIAAGTDNLDTVMIERNEGSATFNSNQGIGYIWKIRAGNQPVSGRQITLTWASRADNGKDLSSMQVYRRPDNGTEWLKVGGLQNGTSRTLTVTTRSFSDWTVSDAGSTLPVTWTSFTGTQTQFGNQLTWSTASEINNQGFTIERSADGKTFTQIGFVKGNGTTNNKQSYQFIDGEIVTAYYRLKQTDFDGKTDYSSTIYVSGAKKELTLSLFPNPTSGRVNLATSMAVSTIEITNNFGQIVFTKVANQSMELDLSFLPKGIYTVKAIGENGAATQKLVIR